MPGVIMENGSRNGSHTNHDRDQRPNGVNGADHGSEKLQEKGKGRAEPLQNMTPTSPTIPNGLGTFQEGPQHQNGEASLISPNMQERVNQLPPEIAHITENYQSLQKLLSRLAQKTHNDVGTKILDLAQMPVPASAVNGNASYITTVDDNSVENNAKKKRLLEFLENTHADWAKALIITTWSRRADELSRMVDIKEDMRLQKVLYDKVTVELAYMQNDLIKARLPNPDLKTALEVLTTGKASWMPELDYITPTPLTAKEVLKTLENIDTILSMRLNLDDYDSIPSQFRDYTIKDGRVTFRVAGEFEVDLTVADENPESQYWFIDLRFLFNPSLSVLNPRIRNPINYRVDEILKQDGLAGCYKYLHEMVLTHKISEFRRQAIDLARGRWAETLQVEALNRALSIQYWVDRFPKGIKSWIILGVHSGRRKDRRPDPKATSRLFIRWFRDGKEVKDVDISFDSINISTESLLRTVIAKHVGHLMTALHEKMSAKPLYVDRDLALTLSISATEPTESELKIQLTNKQFLSIKMEPITGRFVFSPASGRISAHENVLNNQCPSPATDGHTVLDRLRYALVTEDYESRGLTAGWIKTKNPGIRQDALRERLHKDTIQVLWFRRQGWVKDWHLAVSLGMFGEHWQLFETADDPNPVAQTGPRNPAQLNLKIVSHVKIPIKVASPAPTYQFLSTLNIFACALLSHYSNLRALHSRRALHTLRKGRLSSSVSLPSIYVRLSELLPSKNKSARTGKPWAKDIIKITFKGIELLQIKPKEIAPPDPAQNQISQTLFATQQSVLTGLPTPTLEETAVLISEARMIVPVPNALANINEMVDRDIAFNPESGSFSFRLRSKIGESVISSLIERTVRVERLVEFVQVLQKHENVLKCETVSLGKIVFTYGSPPPAPDAMDLDVIADRYKAVVDFSAVENNMQLVLDRGNPHLQIADLLNKVLNGTEGLDGVATLLPLTLPVLRALDTIIASWTSSPFCERADVFNNVRAADWYIIRYNIKNTSPQGSSQQQVRKIMFEVRMRQRRGAPWWHIRRTDNIRTKVADDLDEALKPLWADKGRGWLGMRTSAVAEAHGSEELIGKVDDIVKKLVTSEIAMAAPPIVQAPAPAPAPVQNQARAPAPAQQQQQRQQQPSLNQNQSQSQGRNATVKREVVEID